MNEEALHALKQYEDYYKDQRGYVVYHRYLEAVSGFFMGSLGFYLLLSRKFETQPYPLLGMTFLLQGAHYLQEINIVDLPESEFSAYLLHYSLQPWKEYNMLESISMLLHYRSYIGLILMHVNFLANICLNLELYFTVANPFQPRALRMKYYYLSLLLLLITGLLYIRHGLHG